jgi:hypothetical protein
LTFWTICQCRESGGRYSTDGLKAVIWGDAIPIGFCNSSFIKALQNRPQEEGMGERFEAFVIPVECATITQWDYDSFYQIH